MTTTQRFDQADEETVQQMDLPGGWEVHEHMTAARGYVAGFRTPDHDRFVDIVHLKDHMPNAVRIELIAHVPHDDPDEVSFQTRTVATTDVDTVDEVIDAAREYMERSEEETDGE